VLGVSPKFRLSVEGTRTQPVDAPLPDTEVIPVSAPPAVATIDPEGDGWATVQIPGSKTKPAFADETEAPAVSQNAPTENVVADEAAPAATLDESRYGESVVREVLGATFLSEEKLASASAATDESAVETQGTDEEQSTDSQLIDPEG
jgi:DNA polymerase-3 subunit gamma/tau